MFKSKSHSSASKGSTVFKSLIPERTFCFEQYGHPLPPEVLEEIAASHEWPREHLHHAFLWEKGEISCIFRCTFLVSSHSSKRMGEPTSVHQVYNDSFFMLISLIQYFHRKSPRGGSDKTTGILRAQGARLWIALRISATARRMFSVRPVKCPAKASASAPTPFPHGLAAMAMYGSLRVVRLYRLTGTV